MYWPLKKQKQEIYENPLIFILLLKIIFKYESTHTQLTLTQETRATIVQGM